MNKKFVINCMGDSVTEGMCMNGHHASDYGKDSYPAQLFTILKDNGYDNIEVNNYGHGGECFSDIAARIGGVATYVTEDLVVADNTRVSLGKWNRVNGKNLNTKIKLCYADESGEDMCVYFTQMSHDTNPVIIDGEKYIMSVADNQNYIEKMFTDAKETVIKAGSMLFTANKRTPDVNVIYGGINDGASFTLKKFIDLTKKCAQVNGGRYIVLGSTHAIFNKWSDIPGANKEEKYKYYRRACMENFGMHFIDLYDEFSRHGLDISLNGGCFKDLSQEQKESIRQKLEQHIIPAEFIYNKIEENDVHLSKEGYYVIASLVFERMKLLGYLN